MQMFSYHTHTTFSDGKNSVEEMLNKAVELGLEEIGISDHLIVHKNILKSILSYDKFKDDIVDYNKLFFDNFDKAYEVISKNIAYIRDVSKRYPIKVFVGLEVDFFNEESWLVDIKSLLSKLDLDYLVFGCHYHSYNGNVVAIDLLKEYEKEGISSEVIIREYFKTMEAGIRSGIFDFLAHLDYARKHIKNFDDYKTELTNVFNALEETKTSFEVSTKGLRKVGDFYPTKWIVEELQKRGLPTIISDDSHSIEQLAYQFDKAEEFLYSLNYTNRWKPIGGPRLKHCI